MNAGPVDRAARRGTPPLRRDVVGELYRLLTRHRRLVAALLLAAAAAVAVGALAPAPPPTRPVVVAARDLPAGHRLTADDLAVRHLPPPARPAGAVPAVPAALGRTVAAAVRRGEPLTDARLVGPGLLSGAPAGQVAAPVRVADAAEAALVSPGDVVDVLAVTTGQVRTFADPAATDVGEAAAPSVAPAAATVAAGVLVLATASTDDASGAGLDGLGGALVVVATDGPTARALAAAAAVARLSLVLRSG
ncbi:MAG TPA: Flp pilus assembly protein CpaB [Motilibacteraceae bacterium]|nr:Flp pilus assembly protein CpaB [Motilibacteraceae bacterium]